MTDKKKILIVDDERFYINIALQQLEEQYTLYVAKNGNQALQRMQNNLPDLILLDIVMPEMDGFEVCQRIKSNALWAHIPVLFMTAGDNEDLERKMLQSGGADYICKPIVKETFLNRIRTQLQLHSSADYGVKSALPDLNRQQLIALIHNIAVNKFIAMHDRDTATHAWRTRQYVRYLAQELRSEPAFSEYLNDQVIDVLYNSAALHDIGKITVDDHLLNKQGLLSADEYELMQQHVHNGADALKSIRSKNRNSVFLSLSWEITYFHHERWDGGGYPEGLCGDNIPLSARIMAVCDVYDALVSQRAYKAASNHECAMAYIKEQRGKHFDPAIVDAFMRIEQQVKSVSDSTEES